MKKYLYLILVAAVGCTANEEPEVMPKPVVEAWIDNGRHPQVLFTSTVTPDTDGGELADALLRWGKVTISDGENDYVMTGMRDNDYFPPYRYTTTELVGVPGTTYRITASYKQLRAEAVCTMHEPTRIDSITFSDCGVDTLRAAMLHFTAPDDVPAYYYLTISDRAGSPVSLPCLLGWKECTVPNVAVAVAIMNSKQTVIGERFHPQLRLNGSYVVSLHRVEKPVYDFWRAYDDALLFGSNMLLGSVASLPSNINGGFGVFGARGTDTKAFIVK
ncbi:MAG: DUF4249 domain-containing protein [Muribaculaceae bacterium]|nr:DUF4249 domain-containing protein [Muribaculaceae bacterium]